VVCQLNKHVSKARNTRYIFLNVDDRSARVRKKLNFNPLTLHRPEGVVHGQSSLFLVEGINDYTDKKVQEEKAE